MANKDAKKSSYRKTDGLYNKEIIRERVSHFKEDVHSAGRRFRERAKTKDLTSDSWFYRTFGVMGPLFSSIFGLLVLVFFVWLLKNAAIFLNSSILFALHDFISANLEALFLILLLFSYISYLSRHHPKVYLPFSPITKALGITIFLWIVGGSIQAINTYKSVELLDIIASLINRSLFWLFAFFVFVGYIVLIFRILLNDLRVEDNTGSRYINSRNKSFTSKAPSGFNGKRLYRSGQDKILGGVCGGIGEYLGIDPVLVRILWIVSTLAWGAGILIYLIAWIIIPRNPRHEW